jgi:hypothetical protein
MVDTNNKDLDEAVSALSRAAEAIERRIDATDETIKDVTRQRKTYLTETVERLLPAVSGSVLKLLREEVPAFVTSAVKEGFADNEKIFGLFAGKAYRQKLALLQTRLASYLDQAKYGQLRAMDVDLSQLAAQKTSLNKQSSETRELLKLMQQARKSTAPIPVQLREQITQINKTVRAGHVPAHKRPSAHVSSFSSSSSNYATGRTSDDDLLLYMVTGIPTSMRTLLIDVVTEPARQVETETEVFRGQGGGFGGGGASSDYSTSQDSDSFQSPSDNSGSASLASAASMAGAAVLGGVAAVEIANIATDDSLGRFS